MSVKYAAIPVKFALTFNAYLVISFIVFDFWAENVLQFTPPGWLQESFRFFGISSLTILIIHGSVADSYPMRLFRNIAFGYTIYYFLMASVFYLTMPMTQGVKVHIGILGILSVMFLAAVAMGSKMGSKED